MADKLVESMVDCLVGKTVDVKERWVYMMVVEKAAQTAVQTDKMKVAWWVYL